MKRLTSPAPLAALGNNKGNSTVFLPAGPGGVNDIQGQVCLMHTRGATSLGRLACCLRHMFVRRCFGLALPAPLLSTELCSATVPTP